MHPMGLQGGSGTITNCYYVNPQAGSPINASTVSGAKQAVATATAPANLGDAVEDYGMVKAYQNGILVGGTYYVVPATVTLADNADNGTTISSANGYVANVTLADRTLYKDGAWNTICLPFDVTLAGSALNGATARPLTAASISGTTLNLTFGDAVNTLEAGTPYIIKWTKASDYVDDEAHNLVNPVFSGVTIDNTTRNCVFGSGATQVGFIGTYSNQTFDAEDKNILFMGGSNTLYYPQSGASIGAQRAYFKIGSGDAEAPAFIASFNIDFGDDVTTSVTTPLALGRGAGGEAWYTLDGRKLDGKPTQRGIYINNGKKTIIK